MADRLRSNAVAAVPSTMAEAGLGEASNSQRAWDFRFMETPFQALATFDTRFNYLNVMKLRSVWVPEQAFIEGEGGTSSRNVAAQMAEVFVQSQALLMDEIDDEINRYMIPQLLVVNFPEFVNNGGMARKVSHGFRKEDIEFYKQILQLVGQSSPEKIAEEIDFTELLRRMNTPLRDPNDLERERQQLAEQLAVAQPPLVEPGPGNVGVIQNPKSTKASPPVALFPVSPMEQAQQQVSHTSMSSPMTTSNSSLPTPKSSSPTCRHPSITVTRHYERWHCRCAVCGKHTSADSIPTLHDTLQVLTVWTWPTMTGEFELLRRPQSEPPPD